MIQQTTLQAYNQYRNTFETQCELIKNIIFTYQPISDAEIQRRLIIEYGMYLPRSTVSGRRNDLKKQGINIVVLDKVKDYNTNTTVNAWGVYQHNG